MNMFIPYMEPEKLAASFGSPSSRVHAMVADTRQQKAQREQKIHALKVTLRIILAMIFIGIIVEVAVAFLFNERLVPGNLREELSILDQLTRLAAALGMVAVLMGVVSALHVAFKKGVEMPYRVLAFLAAVVIGAGAYYTAASVGYPVFGSLFAKLWGGSDTTETFKIDASSGLAVLPPDAPFWLRLVASSSLFIGIAFFVAIMELVWLVLRDTLKDIRVALARDEQVLSMYDSAMQSKSEAMAANNKMLPFLDPEYRQAVALAKLTAGIQKYRTTLEGQRPSPKNLAKMSPGDFAQRNTNVTRIDEALKASEAFLDQAKLKELVASIFPLEKTAAMSGTGMPFQSSKATDQKTNRKSTEQNRGKK
jgi:hypothetical protein